MDVQAKTLGRRGMLAGGVGALVAAALGRVSTAKADNGEALVLGVSNSASETMSLNLTKQPDPTGANGGGTGDAFEVAFADGSVRVALGAGSLDGTAVFGQSGVRGRAGRGRRPPPAGSPAGRTRERSGSRTRTSA